MPLNFSFTVLQRDACCILTFNGVCDVSVSSVSMESSIAGTHDEMLQVLKEKMRLEGQLEALSLEANQVENEFEFLSLANYINMLINFREPPTHSLWELCFVKTLLNKVRKLPYKTLQGTLQRCLRG